MAEMRWPPDLTTPTAAGAHPVAAALLLMVETKHRPTYLHLCQVATYTEMFALWLHLSPPEVERFTLAALLHDIGKIAVPAAMLEKPGQLSEAEAKLMRQHTRLGANLLSATGLPEEVTAVALSHHERHDGRGYPQGVAGDAIPMAARMIAVCNAFDAMTTPWPYRRPRPTAEALAEIERCAGSQFDPFLAAAFCAMVREVSGTRRTRRKAAARHYLLA